MSKDLFEGLPLGRRKRSKKGLIALHAKFGIRSCGKAAPCLRTSIGVRDIGLDIIDGCAIHQVSPCYTQPQPFRPLLDADQPHAAETKPVGPKWRAGGEYPHALIAPKARRAHSG